VDIEFGFKAGDDFYENRDGRDEKWSRAEDGAWHFMTPDGSIRRCTTPGKAEGRVVTTVDPVMYTDPLLLPGANSDVDVTRTHHLPFSDLNSERAFSEDNLFEETEDVIFW